MNTALIKNMYKLAAKGPVDAKYLVQTYDELFLPSTWEVTDEDGNIKNAAYNGMLVAVWLDKDTIKNGVYFFQDNNKNNVSSVLNNNPDVTKVENWSKLCTTADLDRLTENGILQDIEVDEAQNKIIFIWDTGDELTREEVSFAKVADIYEGKSTPEITVSIDKNHQISAVLNNQGVSEEKLEEKVQSALKVAREALSAYDWHNENGVLTSKGTSQGGLASEINIRFDRITLRGSAANSYFDGEGYIVLATDQPGFPSITITTDSIAGIKYIDIATKDKLVGVKTADGGEVFNDVDNNTANSLFSHAEGEGTIASDSCQHVQGKYNIEQKNLAHIVGGGASDTNRKNIHTIDWDGNAEFAGSVKSKGKELATEDYVDESIETLVGGAPETLDTLKEIADFLGTPESENSVTIIEKMNNIDEKLANKLDANGWRTTEGGTLKKVSPESSNVRMSISETGMSVSNHAINASIQPGIISIGSDENEDTGDTSNYYNVDITSQSIAGIKYAEIAKKSDIDEKISDNNTNVIQPKLDEKLDANGWKVIPEEGTPYAGTGWYLPVDGDYWSMYHSTILSSQRVSFANYYQDDETCLQDGSLTFSHSRNDGVETGYQYSGITISGLFNRRTNEIYDHNTGETYPAYSHFFNYPTRSGTLVVDKDIEALQNRVTELEAKLNEVETALDRIIQIQNQLIGGN